MEGFESRKRWTRQVLLPVQLLEKLYLQEGYSTGKIAKMLDCSQDTVSRRLREYNIMRRNKKKTLPKSEVLGLYKEKGWKIRDLAQKYNCSHTTIGNRLREWGLLRKSVNQNATMIRQGEKDDMILRAYRSGNSASFIANELGVSRWVILERLRIQGEPIRQSHKKKSLNIQELRYLYLQQHMSTTTLSNIYNVKACTIAARLREAGIPLRGNQLKLSKESIQEHYKRGMSVLKIAETLGCSYTAVRKRLDNWGLYHKRTRLDSESNKIVQMYRDDEYTLAEIANVYGCCENTIANILKRQGIARRKQGKMPRNR